MSRYRKTNHFIEIDGETKLLSDWAKEAGISKELIRDRLNRGWDPDLAVHTPPRKYATRGQTESTDDGK